MADDIRLPSGAKSVSDEVTLPPGASLIQQEQPPSAASRYAGSLVSSLNPFPALKRYLWDLPQQAQQEVATRMQSGDYVGAIKAAAASAPGVPFANDLLRAQVEQARQSAQSARQGDYSEAFGHGLAAVVPAVGPAAAQAGEQIGSGDVAGGLGTATGLLLPSATKELAPAVVGRLGGPAATRLQAAAEKNWYDALNPTKEKMKAVTKNTVAPGLAERGVTANSIADLRDQAQANMQIHGDRIDDIFDQQAQQGKTMPATNLLTAMQDARDGETVGGISFNEPYTNTLDSMMDKVKQLEQKYGGQIPLDELRKLRQSLDTQVSRTKGGFALPVDEGSKADAMRVLPNAIRNEFAQNIPDLADANKQFSFWKNVDDVAAATGLRRIGQKTGLTTRMAQGAGAAFGGAVGGPKGALAGAKVGGLLAKLQGTVWWNSLSAANKMNVADLINQGKTLDALRLASSAGQGAAAQSLSLRSDQPALTPAP